MWAQCRIFYCLKWWYVKEPYLLSPRSRVLLEKLNDLKLVKKIPRILWNLKVHYRIQKSPQHVPMLSQLDSVHTTTFHFLNKHLNIIFPSTPGSPQCSLSLRFLHKNPLHASPLPTVATCPAHLILLDFYHMHNIGWGVQIIKLLIM